MIRSSFPSFGTSEDLGNEDSPREVGGNFDHNSGNGGCKPVIIIIGFRIEIRHSNRFSELGLKMARSGAFWDMLQEEILLRLHRWIDRYHHHCI